MYENVITYTPRAYRPKCPRGAGQLNKWSRERAPQMVVVVVVVVVIVVHPHVSTTGCRLQRQHPTHTCFYRWNGKHTAKSCMKMLPNQCKDTMLPAWTFVTAVLLRRQVVRLKVQALHQQQQQQQREHLWQVCVSLGSRCICPVGPRQVAASEGHFPACRVHCAYVKINRFSSSNDREGGVFTNWIHRFIKNALQKCDCQTHLKKSTCNMKYFDFLNLQQ